MLTVRRKETLSHILIAGDRERIFSLIGKMNERKNSHMGKSSLSGDLTIYQCEKHLPIVSMLFLI